MTKEDIYKCFLEDPNITELENISGIKINELKMINNTDSKILEVIKIVINGIVDNETDAAITRSIHRYFGK